MKTIIIKNYIQGLASFLDEEGIKWEHLGKEVADWIKIYYHNDEELFFIGFNFGKFYEKLENH
jgi:hypothetical protein